MENIDETLKTKEDGRLNQEWVQDLIMQVESISTPHICYTQREPLS